MARTKTQEHADFINNKIVLPVKKIEVVVEMCQRHKKWDLELEKHREQATGTEKGKQGEKTRKISWLAVH